MDVHAQCNHARPELLANLAYHRWYGCNDCGAVFEVAEHQMIEPLRAAQILEFSPGRQEASKLRDFAEHFPRKAARAARFDSLMNEVVSPDTLQENEKKMLELVFEGTDRLQAASEGVDLCDDLMPQFLLWHVEAMQLLSRGGTFGPSMALLQVAEKLKVALDLDAPPQAVGRVLDELRAQFCPPTPPPEEHPERQVLQPKEKEILMLFFHGVAQCTPDEVDRIRLLAQLVVNNAASLRMLSETDGRRWFGPSAPFEAAASRLQAAIGDPMSLDAVIADLRVRIG